MNANERTKPTGDMYSVDHLDSESTEIKNLDPRDVKKLIKQCLTIIAGGEADPDIKITYSVDPYDGYEMLEAVRLIEPSVPQQHSADGVNETLTLHISRIPDGVPHGSIYSYLSTSSGAQIISTTGPVYYTAEEGAEIITSLKPKPTIQ